MEIEHEKVDVILVNKTNLNTDCAVLYMDTDRWVSLIKNNDVYEFMKQLLNAFDTSDSNCSNMYGSLNLNQKFFVPQSGKLSLTMKIIGIYIFQSNILL